jgi:hypothetical protein
MSHPTLNGIRTIAEESVLAYFTANAGALPGVELRAGQTNEIRSLPVVILHAESARAHADFGSYNLGNFEIVFKIYVYSSADDGPGGAAITTEEALDFGFTGPCLRACGIDYDVLSAAVALRVPAFDVAANPAVCLLPLPPDRAPKCGRPRKHPLGFDGLGNRTDQTVIKGIYRVTYKTGGTVWRVSVYCRGKNAYVGTFNSEILGALGGGPQTGGWVPARARARAPLPPRRRPRPAHAAIHSHDRKFVELLTEAQAGPARGPRVAAAAAAAAATARRDADEDSDDDKPTGIIMKSKPKSQNRRR